MSAELDREAERQQKIDEKLSEARRCRIAFLAGKIDWLGLGAARSAKQQRKAERAQQEMLGRSRVLVRRLERLRSVLIGC